MNTIKFITILSVLAISSCSTNSTDDLTEIVILNKENKVSYESQIKPIMASNCIACHGAVSSVGSISLNDYNSVKTSVLSNVLLNRINLDPALSVSAMPQGGPRMAQINLDLIAKWKADGYAQ